MVVESLLDQSVALAVQMLCKCKWLIIPQCVNSLMFAIIVKNYEWSLKRRPFKTIGCQHVSLVSPVCLQSRVCYQRKLLTQFHFRIIQFKWNFQVSHKTLPKIDTNLPYIYNVTLAGYCQVFYPNRVQYKLLFYNGMLHSCCHTTVILI